MKLRLCALFAFLTHTFAADPPRDIFARENLVAWCIVPFDAKKRGPEERAAMLENMGIRRLAYDYRAEHIPTFDAELDALARHHIELTAWWFPTVLNDEAKLILDVIARHGVHPQLWVMGGGEPVKDDAEQRARVEAEAARLRPIAEAAAKIGCQLALYNHGGWFGEPENQIAIIEKLAMPNVGIVYNLHHGHEHLDRFPALLAKMKPHLLALNLNGMTRDGESTGRKIMPLGQGDLDLELLRTIRASGWHGPVGLLNHTDEDAEARLLDNRDGLDWLVPQLGGAPAGPKPVPRSWRNPTPPPSGSLIEGKAEYRQPPLTVECRAKLNGKGGFNVLVACDTKASAAHWEIFTMAGDGKLAAYHPGYTPDHTRSEVDICDGQPHFIAMQFEAERVRLWLDGRVVADQAVKRVRTDVVPGGLAFGRVVEGNIGCDGAIEDVRLSRGVRDVSKIPSGPLQRDDSTLGVWHFDAPPQTAEATIEDAAERAKLPEFQTIPAAKPDELTRANGWPKLEEFRTWSRSLGGPTSNRFSALDQINKANVARLAVAWTYHSGDGAANIQCNPVIVGDAMFLPTAGRCIVALDAATGRERWRFGLPVEGPRQEDVPARRGLLHWPGDATHAARVIFAAGNWIYALDAKTGKPLAEFGKDGRTEIPTGGTVAGAVYRHLLVVPGYLGDVFGYDVRTGERLWTFHTRPLPGEFGADTWSSNTEGANCWGGMALDESRGIAVVSTGSPKPNFFGMDHTGDNLFSNCVIALDALTGKRLWHFQDVRHDVWDWDIPAPPNLVTVERDGVRVDAVAQVTKLGNTLLLDRTTGKPLFPFRLRRAPTSRLPGERTAAYQPAPELPEPFARQHFTMDDLTNRTPEARAVMLPLAQRANAGWFPPLEEGRPTIEFCIHGGAQWTGAAADPRNGRLFVSSNEIPWAITVFRDDDPQPAQPPTPGEQVYQMLCAACHAPNRVGIGHAPPLRGVRHRLGEAELRALFKTGRNTMPPLPQLTEEQTRAVIDFVLCRDRPITKAATAKPAWTFSGWNKMLDPEGYPACTPPWGTLNCIDLNTGRIAWRVPLGEYDELSRAGVPKTGTENFGGAMATAGGLVFVSGTRDRKIRAFDADNGAELWSAVLPLHGTAPPASYEVAGRQFVVLPVTGGGKLGGDTGDAWMAFALPAK